MVFLPSDAALSDRCQQAFERIAQAEGCGVVGWRRVAVNPGPLGELAQATQPEVRQILLARRDIPRAAFERKLYVIRRLVEKEVAAFAEDASRFCVASLSSRTVVYKGMLTATQLPQFYPDLRDERFESAFGIVHQRYSTNTFPMWRLAQPFRILAHNGEINTLRGNITRMRAREARLASELFGPDLEKIKPVILEGGSDSAVLDNVAELLLMSGRSLPHVMMMLVPEAWGAKFLMSEDKRAFYEYHSAVMEPWDGPAALVFTDGSNIGATLDRNGLRPARYTVTRDGLVVLASETGVLDIPGDRILSRGRLQPGKMFLVDLSEHRIIPDNEIKAKVSRQRPYRHWVKERRIELRGLLAPSQVPPEEPEVLRRKQRVFGYTEEDLKMIIAPMAARGQEAVGSMGNDAALAVLSRRPQLLFAYFKQLFAQVTNPPIDPLREELVMSLMSFVGRERNLLAETPEHCWQLKLHHPILTPEDLLRLRNVKHPEVVARDLDILFPAEGDGKALEAALDAVFLQAEQHLAQGATLLILTDRGLDEKRAPIPSLLAASGLHHHLIRKGLRTAAGIVVETGETREVIHFGDAAGVRRERDLPVRRLLHRARPGRKRHARGGRDAGRGHGFVHHRGQERADEDVQPHGHLDHPQLLRLADLRGGRPRAGTDRQVFHAPPSRASAASAWRKSPPRPARATRTRSRTTALRCRGCSRAAARITPAPAARSTCGPRRRSTAFSRRCA